MRVLHGTCRKVAIAPHSNHFNSDVPTWVAETGLEWLYGLVLRSENLLRVQSSVKR